MLIFGDNFKKRICVCSWTCGVYSVRKALRPFGPFHLKCKRKIMHFSHGRESKVMHFFCFTWSMIVHIIISVLLFGYVMNYLCLKCRHFFSLLPGCLFCGWPSFSLSAQEIWQTLPAWQSYRAFNEGPLLTSLSWNRHRVCSLCTAGCTALSSRVNICLRYRVSLLGSPVRVGRCSTCSSMQWRKLWALHVSQTRPGSWERHAGGLYLWQLLVCNSCIWGKPELPHWL